MAVDFSASSSYSANLYTHSTDAIYIHGSFSDFDFAIDVCDVIFKPRSTVITLSFLVVYTLQLSNDSSSAKWGTNGSNDSCTWYINN